MVVHKVTCAVGGQGSTGSNEALDFVGKFGGLLAIIRGYCGDLAAEVRDTLVAVARVKIGRVNGHTAGIVEVSAEMIHPGQRPNQKILTQIERTGADVAVDAIQRVAQISVYAFSSVDFVCVKPVDLDPGIGANTRSTNSPDGSSTTRMVDVKVVAVISVGTVIVFCCANRRWLRIQSTVGIVGWWMTDLRRSAVEIHRARVTERSCRHLISWNNDGCRSRSHSGGRLACRHQTITSVCIRRQRCNRERGWTVL